MIRKTELPAWIREKNGEITLTLRATPRASRSEISGAEDEWVKVRLKAAPVDGKANKELISFFAKLLKLPKKDLKICSGETSRLKRIALRGVTVEDILKQVEKN